jgi:hypothetical protein
MLDHQFAQFVAVDQDNFLTLNAINVVQCVAAELTRGQDHALLAAM